MTEQKCDQERQALDDWFVYGPRSPEIAMMVQRLVDERGLRTTEIEVMILRMLENELARHEGSDGGVHR